MFGGSVVSCLFGCYTLVSLGLKAFSLETFLFSPFTSPLSQSSNCLVFAFHVGVGWVLPTNSSSGRSSTPWSGCDVFISFLEVLCFLNLDSRGMFCPTCAVLFLDIHASWVEACVMTVSIFDQCVECFQGFCVVFLLKVRKTHGKNAEDELKDQKMRGQFEGS